MTHFLKSKSLEKAGDIPAVSKRALDVLNRHEWPGNVRELENAIERACTLCDDGLIRVADLPQVLCALADETISDDDVALAPKPDTAFMEKSSTIQPTAVPVSAGSLNQPIGSLKDYIREQEHGYLQRAIGQAGGDKETAARMLGVSLATLYRKLAEVEEGA